MVHLLKLLNEHWYNTIIKPWTLFGFHQFSHNVPLLFQDLMPESLLHLTVMFPQSPLVCDSFHLSFGGAVHVFYRISLSLDLPNVFS